MKLKNSLKHYGFIAKIFHWSSALLIVGLFVVGLWMVDLDYEHQWYDRAFHWHESIGILCALFMALRWLWRQINVLPEFDQSLSMIEKRLAIIVHRLMYLSCLIVLVSGYLIPTANGRHIDVFTWFFVPALFDLQHQQIDLAGSIHVWLACSLMALASIHALAALKHYLIDKQPLNKLH